MKCIIPLYFLLLLSPLFCLDIHKQSGLKNSIYTTCFDFTLLENSPIKTSYKSGNSLDYRFTVDLYKSIYLDIQRHELRDIKSLDLYSYPFSKTTIGLINTFSEENNYSDQIIHHSLYLKRSGDITVWALGTTNYSRHSRNGYKVLLGSDINYSILKWKTLYNTKKDYLSPYYTEQYNGFRVRSELDLTLFRHLELSPKVNYSQLNYIETFKSSFYIGFPTNYNTTSFGINFKSKTEEDVEEKLYIGEIKTETSLPLFSHKTSIKCNYINSIFYSGHNALIFHYENLIKLKLEHKWLYLEQLKHELKITLKLKLDRIEVSLNYKGVNMDGSEPWILKGEIGKKY